MTFEERIFAEVHSHNLNNEEYNLHIQTIIQLGKSLMREMNQREKRMFLEYEAQIGLVEIIMIMNAYKAGLADGHKMLCCAQQNA